MTQSFVNFDHLRGFHLWFPLLRFGALHAAARERKKAASVEELELVGSQFLEARLKQVSAQTVKHQLGKLEFLAPS